MKKLIVLLLALTMITGLLSACGSDSNTDATTAPANSNEEQGTKAEGDGTEAVYRQMYSSEVLTHNYLTSPTIVDHRTGANTIDTLIEYDANGNLQPSLATEWKMSEDGITYTFTLRAGQKWVDSTGAVVADVTAQDFVDAMKYVLTPEYESATSKNMFGIIKNAKEYYNGLAGEEGFSPIDFSEVGIKAIDESTLEYTLEGPVPYFLSSLTYVNYMPAYGPLLLQTGKEFGTAADKMYYCGAYYMSSFKPQEETIYTKNTNNWDADKVYITKIERTYNSESQTLAPEAAKRGELDYAEIDSTILDDWLSNDATKNMVSKERPDTSYSYFYSFNFDPQFDAKYEPDNWRLAVNNENFRQAMMAALNRMNPMSISEPNVPETYIMNTITPKTFAFNSENKDYTELEPFKEIMARDSFDAKKAVQFKEAAMPELTKLGVTFPIKVLMPYNPTITNWDKECQVVEQQMESVLGSDFIDIIIEAGPSDGFLDVVRRGKKYAFMKCGWGADYADPQTWIDPFYQENDADPGYKYQYIRQAMIDNTATAAVASEYFKLVEEAKAITIDIDARFEAFAKAEAYLINHALVVPYGITISDYLAIKLDVFEGQYAPFGVSPLRYKGQHLQDHFISMEEYEANGK